MLSQEEIDEQLQLLHTYRRTLATYLRQQAAIGEAYSPPALLYGIAEARSQIQRIKSALRVAGVQVPADIDDEEPPSIPIVPRMPRRARTGLLMSTVGAALLVIGLALARFGGPLLSGGTPAAPQAALSTTPAAGMAPTMLAPPGSTAPGGGQPALATLTSVEEIEPLLLQANVRLSLPEDEERTRSYFTGPESAYHKLAVAVLVVVGERRFRQPVYLDQVDKWYTQAAGSGYAERGSLDLEKVQQALLAAHNDYYGDDASTLDALLAPRS